MTDIRCGECNKQFSKQDALDMHNKSKHWKVGDGKQPLKMPKFLKDWKVLAGIAVVVLFALMFAFGPSPSITAKVGEPLGYSIHWHPEVRIIINGRDFPLDQNIGIGSSVHADIHTHANDGVIHLETVQPTSETVKLGNFFRIWGKTFNSECILEYCNNEEQKVSMFVNDEENFEFEEYSLQEGDYVEIRYE